MKSLFSNVLKKKNVDATLVGFFANMLHGAIVVFVAIAVSVFFVIGVMNRDFQLNEVVFEVSY